MSKKMVFGNWKMNTTYGEAMILASGVERRTEDLEGVEVAIFPPSPWLVSIKEKCKRLHLGAQNMYSKLEGAYTGEVSGNMLKGIVKYVLLGHSERRSVFNEDSALVAAKLKTALNLHLSPVLAVGEEQMMSIDGKTQEEINKFVVDSTLGKMLIASTERVDSDDWRDIVIAYEPVWAIGTGKNATGKYATAIIEALRSIIAQKTSRGIANAVPILYGGSVTRHNAPEFAEAQGVDGVLVGGASLKLADFVAIAEIFNQQTK